MKSAKFLKTLFVCIAFFLLLALCTSAQDVKPGINVLTGTSEPLTFEDGKIPENVTKYLGNIEIVDCPQGIGSGKLLRSSASSWGAVKFNMPVAVSKDVPIYVSFKAYKDSVDGTAVSPATSFFIMKNDVNVWQIIKRLSEFELRKWYTHSYLLDNFGKLEQVAGVPDNSDTNAIILEYDAAPANNIYVYFDDVEIVPAYKITYYDDDLEEIACEYKHFAKDVKHFVPTVTEEQLKDGIKGWALTPDGSKVSAVELKNENIELYAVYGESVVKPGINVLTGTNEPLTFEDGVIPSNLTKYIGKLDVIDYPKGLGSGKLMRNTTTGDWGIFKVDMPKPVNKDTAFYISFKAYKDTVDGTDITPATSFYIMKNSLNLWQVAKQLPDFLLKQWYNHSYIIDTFGRLESAPGVIDTSDISSIIFEYDTRPAGNIYTYFDDIEVVPAYRITYFDDNLEEISHEFKHFKQNETVFVPTVSDLNKEMSIIGWATTPGGEIVESIELKNEHINLFAIYDDAIKVTATADKNLFTSVGKTATIKATLYQRGKEITQKAKFELVQGDSVSLKDNENGTATVTSVKNGESVIKAYANDGSSALVHFVTDSKSESAVQLSKITLYLGSNFIGYNAQSYYDSAEGCYVFINDSSQSQQGDGFVIYGINNFSVEQYPYLNITYKSETQTTFQAAFACTDPATQSTKWVYPYPSSKPITLDASQQYVTLSFDLSEKMLAYDEGAWHTGMLGLITADETVCIKEVYLSNMPANELVVKKLHITKQPQSLEINKDGAKLDFDATVISNTASQDKSLVSWTVSDTSVANLTKNYDGSVTISPLKNGSVTLIATNKWNEQDKKEFIITITNQRAKTPVYNFRILFWGASTFKHGSAPSIGWYYPWGMAATAEEKDIVHRVMYHLREKYNCDIDFVINSTSVYDATISKDTDSNKDYTSDPNYRSLMADARALKPNIMVVGQMGNLSGSAKVDCVVNAYSQIFSGIYEISPDIIVAAQCCTISHMPVAEAAYQQLADIFKAQELQYNDIANSRGPNYFPAPGTYAHQGVQNHPGDEGMDQGAIGLVALIENVMHKITPEYVYLPDSIEISGQQTITQNGGKAELTVNAYPYDASNAVNYEIDNTNIATIDDNGVLTAKYNGTVTVTAKSKYCDAQDTFIVEITGQPDYYTVSYDAGTTDTVTNLPQSATYINGEYKTGKTVPQRELYDFVGWSLEPNGEVAQSFDINEDTTLYAVWKKTAGFEFDGDYDENIGFTYGFDIKGGFHNAVINGKLETICSVGAPVTFVSPKLDISNKGEMVFALYGGYYHDGGTLDIKVNDREYKADIAQNGAMTEYRLDISDAGQRITSFEIFYNCIPADNSMFTISIDYIHFGKDEAVSELKIVDFANSKAVIACPEETTATVVFASYSGQKVTDVEVQKNITLLEGQHEYSASQNFSTLGADTVKVMIFDTFDNAMPLTSAKAVYVAESSVN